MVPLELKKYQSLYYLNKKYKKMEIKLSKLVMQKSTCNMLVLFDKYVWYKYIFILLFICHVIDVLYFFYIFPIERSMLTKKQNGYLIY